MESSINSCRGERGGGTIGRPSLRENKGRNNIISDGGTKKERPEINRDRPRADRVIGKGRAYLDDLTAVFLERKVRAREGTFFPRKSFDAAECLLIFVAR